MKKRTKFTPELKARFLELLRQGNYASATIKALGITPQGLWDYKKRNPEFVVEIKQAESEAEINAVNRLILAGEHDAKYLCWFLSRKYPDRWGDHRNEIKDLKKEIQELRDVIFKISEKTS